MANYERVKYLLWFALPHVLADSPAHPRFKGRRTILVNATSATSIVIETATGLRRVSVAPSGWVTLD